MPVEPPNHSEEEWAMRIINLAVAVLLSAAVACDAPSPNGGLVGPGGNPAVTAVVVSPSSATVTVGGSAQLTAVAVDRDGNTVADAPIAWGSTDSEVADVSTSGRVTARKRGNSRIKATTSGIEGSATVDVIDDAGAPVATVSVALAASALVIGQGTQATATLRDQSGAVLGGRAVTWASSNTNVAAVGQDGYVSAVSAGFATITATSEGKSGSATLAVSDPPATAVATVSVTPGAGIVETGKTLQLTATPRDASGNPLSGRTVAWASSAEGVATVSSSGLVTGVSVGTVTITASSEGKTGSATVQVSTPAPPGVVSILITPETGTIDALNQSLQLTATAKDANGATVPGVSFIWRSLNSAIATVGTTGNVISKGVGTVLIIAAAGTIADTAAITVRQVPATIVLNNTSLTVTVGGTGQLVATVRDGGGTAIPGSPVTWSSSASSIASVSSAGVVTGVAVGQATVTAAAGELSAAASVTVETPPEGSGYYVSPSGSSQGDGSAARPWDLQTALSGAGGRVQPGDTVWIRGGTYPNGGNLTVSGSTAGYITFSGYPGETAIIKKQFAGTASYVVIQQLVFEGPINGATNQVYLHDNHHVVFTRNEIRNGDFHAGLSVDESHHYTITYNYIHDNGRDVSHDHGIYFKTTTGEGTVIANNLLIRNAARGLSLHDNSGAGVYDVVVAHNTIVGNGSTGILINDGDRNTLVNNIVVNNGDQTGQDQIRVLAGNGNKVWNNLTWHATASDRRGIENTTSSEMASNVVADPLLVSYVLDPGLMNLRLTAGSPAINIGRTGFTFGGKDYAGKTRDANPDVGAYEHSP
jgi:parallel beta-helix repeat protein